MANAQYVIDIAAKMSGGEQTNAQLDELTAQLMGGGKGAEHFSQALVKVSGALDVAKAASVAANDALGAGQAEYRNLERAALQAAKAAEKAALKGVVPPDVAAKAAQAQTAVERYAGTLRGLEQAADRAGKEEDQLAQSLANVKKLSGHVDKSIAGNAERLGKLQGALGAVGGPLGSLGSGLVSPIKGFAELSSTMGSARAAALLGVVGFAAVAAAVVAVTVAVIAGTLAVAAWAVGLADGARNAALAREALEAARPELVALRGEFAALKDATGLGDAALAGLEKTLREAKVAAEDMPDALRAAALAERALGTGGSAAFVDEIKAGKRAVGALAAETQAKFGGIVAKQMMGLDAQSARLKSNIGGVFGGLDIDPVLEGFSKLVGLFDQNTAAGETMKFLFESVFQPLIDSADEAATVIEAFALGFLIGLTKVYIAVKPAIKAVSEFFGFEDSSLTDTLDMAKKAGELIVPVFLVFVGIVGTLAAVVGVAVVAVVAIQAAIYGMIAAVIYAGVQIVQGVIGGWNAVTEFLGGLNLTQMGTDLIMGLVNGITGAAGFVKDAVAGAVNGAIASAKSALGIHSPSTLMADEIGAPMGEGVAMGAEEAAPEVQSALTAMVAPPELPASPLSQVTTAATTPASSSAPASGGGGGGASAGASVNMAGATFNFYGVEGADDAERRFGELLTRTFEGDVMQSGGGEAASP